MEPRHLLSTHQRKAPDSYPQCLQSTPCTWREGTLPAQREATKERQEEERILLGDFNLHLELWEGGLRHDQAKVEAEQLINLITETQLNILLPQGTETRPEMGQNSAVHLVFAIPELEDRLVTCGIADGIQQRC